MYVVTNRISITPGNGADLEERFGPRGGVENQEGFMGFELWKQKQDEDHEEYLVVTHWESEEAFKGWIGSESFRESVTAGSLLEVGVQIRGVDEKSLHTYPFNV